MATPSQELWGRAAKIRFTSKRKDVTFLGGYPPPHASTKDECAQQSAFKTNKCLKQQYNNLLARTFPVFGIDANTQLGLCRDGATWSTGVGEHNLGVPTALGESWHLWLDAAGVTSTNTLHATAGPTYSISNATPHSR